MLFIWYVCCVGAYRSFVCLVCVVFVPIVLHSPLGMWERSMIDSTAHYIIIFIQI